jgi:hypothetical protein
MPRRTEEHQQQAAFFRWADTQTSYPLATMHAIPNAARRSPRQGKWLKDEGLRAGVWDINLPIPQGDWHGLWLEFKVKPNVLTDTQEAFKSLIEPYCMMRVCYSWTAAKAVVEEYFAVGKAVAASDCQSVVESMNDPRVKWIPREQNKPADKLGNLRNQR